MQSDAEADRVMGCVAEAYIAALKSGRSYREASAAARAALRAARPDVAAVLDGEAVAVPREPTEAMCKAPMSMAGWRDMSQALRAAGLPNCVWDAAYRAMLAASPYAPPRAGGGE